MLAIAPPWWDYPLHSTDKQDVYLDANGKEVEFPSDLILWEEPMQSHQSGEPLSNEGEADG